MEEHSLLACSPWFAQSAFLYTPAPQWAEPFHVNHSSSKCLQTCLQAVLWSMETLSQLRVLFPDNSSLCQVDRKLTRTRCGGRHSGLEHSWKRRKAGSKTSLAGCMLIWELLEASASSLGVRCRDIGEHGRSDSSEFSKFYLQEIQGQCRVN